MGYLERLMIAARAFRLAYLHADSPGRRALPSADTWTPYAARAARYELLRAYDQNDVYSAIYGGASAQYKAETGMYDAARPVFNPTNRLNTFGAIHIHGGALDPDAGDGTAVPSALPIETKADNVRVGLSRLWEDSHWAIQKYLLGRTGTMLGDVVIKVCDDPVLGQVRLNVMAPDGFERVGFDRSDHGGVLWYIYREERDDPDEPPPAVTDAATGALPKRVVYKERVRLEGGRVHYETYRDDRQYDWSGRGSAWSEPYGFVPIRFIQHDNIGLDWGMAEVHPQLGLVREINDLASMMTDHARLSVRAPMAVTGINNPADFKVAMPRTAPTADNPDPIRTEVPLFLLRDPAARTTQLVPPLDAHAIEHLHTLLKEIERELPELAEDIWATGDTSGRALRYARQRVEKKYAERRASYNHGTVMAQRMALAIGGWRGYEGYSGFGLDDYRNGKALDHNIGPVKTFAADEYDVWELKKLIKDTARVAVSGGEPLGFFYKYEDNWSDADVAELEAAQVADAARANPDGTLTSQTVTKVDAAAKAPGDGAKP